MIAYFRELLSTLKSIDKRLANLESTIRHRYSGTTYINTSPDAYENTKRMVKPK